MRASRGRALLAGALALCSIGAPQAQAADAWVGRGEGKLQALYDLADNFIASGGVLETIALALLVISACLFGVAGAGLLNYQSRRSMVRTVRRAEALLARRGAKAPANDRAARETPIRRLRTILDEIERRDDELSRSFAELDTALRAAEDANRSKTQFLVDMSHELRTPLSAIVGYSEFLMETAGERGAVAEHQELARMRSAAHRMLALVNDVLDLSKIEAGAVTLAPDRFDLDALVAEAVTIATPAARANGNSIIVDAGHLGAVFTDGLKLAQCLLNLMANAARFTKDGKIKLRARRGSGWLEFDVIDTGVGMSPETQARVFRPFVRTDASTNRTSAGTGLRLAITHRLARMLGGDVTVRSALGQGSAFTLRIPATLPFEVEVPLAAEPGCNAA